MSARQGASPRAEAPSSPGERLVRHARRLALDCDALRFGPPVTHVYNPLRYASASHGRYLRRYAGGPKKTLFVGMNPGPWGMAQTGVPFGEVRAVREWLGIEAPVGRPDNEHPARPVRGFDCQRSEVSGRRLWGVFAQRYGSAEAFFSERMVLNYCPLLFSAASGKRCRNLTPDALPAGETQALFAHCDRFLRHAVRLLSAEVLVGVGRFAEARLLALFGDGPWRIGRIAHPSPANPAANSDYAGLVGRQLDALDAVADGL